MPKNNLNVKASLPKTNVSVNYTRSVYRPDNKVMNAKQQAQLGRMQQRTTRKMANKLGEYIKAGGQAVSSVTTPFATALTTKYTGEQIVAKKRAENELAKWNSLKGANPDKDKGSDPNDQESETSTTKKPGSSGSSNGG